MSPSIAASQTILVAGGGISGMTAALEAAWQRQAGRLGRAIIQPKKLQDIAGK